MKTKNTLAGAISQIIKSNSGMKCPHGCGGCAWRMFGLVSHLMEKHGYTERAAWKKAEET